MKQVKRLMIIGMFMAASHATQITDTQLGYSITLPENWVREIVSDTSHQFIDTTDTYRSSIHIVRTDFSSDTLFTSPEEWTRANFIGYSFIIDADPFSTLVYYDTVTAALPNSDLRVADAFSSTYSADTAMFDWGEYIRYTATGSYGFELYAIGELDDINLNIEFYRNIINSITINSESPVVHPRPIALQPAVQKISRFSGYRINLLGKQLRTAASRHASQIVVDHRNQTGTVR